VQRQAWKERPAWEPKHPPAIAYTVTYCKEHGILADFLENLSPEEVNMLAAEWKLEDALRVREEEGIQIGEQRGKLETARNLKSFGIAIEQLARATGLSYDEIAKL
jgi:predicted transposase/invertase (TIGR01784 family)